MLIESLLLQEPARGYGRMSKLGAIDQSWTAFSTRRVHVLSTKKQIGAKLTGKSDTGPCRFARRLSTDRDPGWSRGSMMPASQKKRIRPGEKAKKGHNTEGSRMIPGRKKSKFARIELHNCCVAVLSACIQAAMHGTCYVAYRVRC